MMESTYAMLEPLRNEIKLLKEKVENLNMIEKMNHELAELKTTYKD